MLELIQQYPFLMWVLLILAAIAIPLLIALGVISFKQGREFSTPLFKIGPRVFPPDQSPGDSQAAQRLTAGDLDEIVQRVRDRLVEYREDEGIPEESLAPDLPAMSDHTLELFKMKVEIGRKVREIVLGWGGGWAGSSLAGFDTYRGLASQHGLVDESILQEIGEFEWLSIPGIYGDEIGDQQFHDAAQLAGKILRQLDEIEVGPLS